MASITLSFKPRGKRLRSLPKDLSFAADTPIAAVYKQLSDDTSLSVYRLRCTNSVDNKVLDNTKEDATVESAGLKDGGVVFVKDL
ncbi:3-oxo-5a-steroid 4- dehydrogenase, partial [Ascosphaera atra]